MLATKTAVIYIPFLGLEVKQDIDVQLYCANDILEAYNKNNNDNKRLDKYLDFSWTKEFIAVLDSKSNSPSQGDLKNDLVIKTKKGKFWWTRMNKHLVVDFMMWLSAEFKYQAIDFILKGESLAIGRHNIKEWYKQMTTAIQNSWKTDPREYAYEATMLNVLVSWSPASNQRARYWEDKMQLMDDMQKANATLINAWIDINTRKSLLIKQFL